MKVSKSIALEASLLLEINQAAKESRVSFSHFVSEACIEKLAKTLILNQGDPIPTPPRTPVRYKTEKKRRASGG